MNRVIIVGVTFLASILVMGGCSGGGSGSGLTGGTSGTTSGVPSGTTGGTTSAGATAGYTAGGTTTAGTTTAGTTTAGTTTAGTTTAGTTTAGTTTSGGTTGGVTPTATIATINNAAAPMGFSFTSPVTVKSGTSVTWLNQSSAPHSIVWDSHTPAGSPSPGADIPVFQAGSASQAFIAPTVTTTTTYNYHCGIHGPTMNGQIVVTP